MNVTRNTYFKRLQELSDTTDHRVMFVSADCAGLVFDEYRKAHPERFINVGIAEQNMIAVACGLALAGKRPVAYGHAPFAVTRALDQIRNCAAIMKLPVSIVVNGVGFAQPYFGATHFNTEDFCTVSLIPGLRVIMPSSPSMGFAAANQALVAENPLYVRFDPDCDAELYEGRIIDFSKGFEVLRQGGDIAVIASGSYTHRALTLAKDLDAMVIDVYSVPFDTELLLATIGERAVLTIEEQTIYGTLGLRLLWELNARGLRNTMRCLGISFDGAYPDMSTRDSSYFQKIYGLTDDSITAAMNALRSK
jgi:transketolase